MRLGDLFSYSIMKWLVIIVFSRSIHCKTVLMLQRQNKPGTIRAPKSHAEELNAMRHGPELHDALRKTQSAGNKLPSSTGNRLSGGDIQQSVTRQTQSVHSPETRQSVHGNYALNNGTAGMRSTQHRCCFLLR